DGAAAEPPPRRGDAKGRRTVAGSPARPVRRARSARRSWIGLALVAGIAAIVLALWQPWRKDPAQAAAPTNPTAPLEPRKLVTRAGPRDSQRSAGVDRIGQGHLEQHGHGPGAQLGTGG